MPVNSWLRSHATTKKNCKNICFIAAREFSNFCGRNLLKLLSASSSDMQLSNWPADIVTRLIDAETKLLFCSVWANECAQENTGVPSAIFSPILRHFEDIIKVVFRALTVPLLELNYYSIARTVFKAKCRNLQRW